ncbi:MAG: iron-containing alcohol dehydrogenase [Clostridia bacterium]|nr:iron-containing alcohol dehydrogenase [Clostridia bacterium]
MQIESLLKPLRNCPCGKSHTVGIRDVQIGRGLLPDTAHILRENHFPTNILVVSGTRSFAAADGIMNILQDGGFSVRLHVFDGVHTSHQSDVDAIVSLCDGADGLLFIGTGSLGDVCRRACYIADKEFAIFATAPSMDGFASDTAPITIHNFKISLPAREPSVIIADTDILAAAPSVLRSAGFGDIMGKAIGLADWKIGALTTGEYYCENVASLTRDAFRSVCAAADRIPMADPESAGILMQALVVTGMAMKLCGSSRAAAGAEHVVSHCWEIKTLEAGRTTAYHGKKVGVAALMITRMYYDLCEKADPSRFGADETDWNRVYAFYGDLFSPDVRKCNSPSVTAGTTPQILREKWDAICDAVHTEMPSPAVLENLLRRAGAATTADEIDISPELCLGGLEFHPYMRHRMLLSRLVPMLHCETDYPKWAGIS